MCLKILKKGIKMPINTYKCNKCDFKEEYIESFSIKKENWHPEICPECNKGKLEKVFDYKNSHGGFDIVGWCFENTQGKKAWKRNLSVSEQSEVINGTRDPY